MPIGHLIPNYTNVCAHACTHIHHTPPLLSTIVVITPSHNHSQRERYRNVAFHAYLFVFSWTPLSSLAMTFLCPQLHHMPMPELNTAKGNYHDQIGLVETHLSPPQLRGDPVSPDVRSTLMSYMPSCKTTHDSLCNEKKKKIRIASSSEVACLVLHYRQG